MNRQVKSTILTAALLLTGTTVGAENRSESKNQQAMKAIELTAEAFQKQVFDYTKNSEWKYEGDLPAVIDFYATWCGPCKAMAPVMETLAEEYAGRVHIYKVDVDKEKRLAALFGVRSIPTFIFILRREIRSMPTAQWESSRCAGSSTARCSAAGDGENRDIRPLPFSKTAIPRAVPLRSLRRRGFCRAGEGFLSVIFSFVHLFVSL